MCGVGDNVGTLYDRSYRLNVCRHELIDGMIRNKNRVEAMFS